MSLGHDAGLTPHQAPLRNVFGDALLAVATENPRVVVLDGDLGELVSALRLAQEQERMEGEAG